MFEVRDRLIGTLEVLDKLEVAKAFAKAYSKFIFQLVEVVDTETGVVISMFLEGKEWHTEESLQLGLEIGIPDSTAKQLGKSIWEDLANRHELLIKLRKKLSLSIHEQKQFEVTQDKVAEREAQLTAIMSDKEYVCCYYKFIHPISPSYMPEPHYCDRQIRRYVSQALKKTGQTAHIEKWKTIGLRLTSLDNHEYDDDFDDQDGSTSPWQV